MEYKNIFEELVDRGYFEQATYVEELKELLSKERVKFYVGFDATADSLTIGHFIQIMVMKRMQNYGHIPIALLGGGTTMIGDPSGRSDMRMVMTEEQINHNAQRFFEQLSRFIDFSDGNAIIENNKDWLLDLNFIRFMKEVGVHFSVNKMLTCDAYKNRMEKGLTFFEFSYMLMQSYDFLYLYRKHGCKLQLGGSDQWSNILGGYDLVRKLEQDKVYAMTFKLLTTADGVKMGKSQKGAVWLDEEKTSPYELFQYMRNVDDRDVEKFLLMLTFLPTEKCRELGKYKEVNLFLRGIVPLVGFQYSIVSYKREERIAGESHYPLNKMVKLAVDGITSLSVKPIRMITILGVCTSFFSFLLIVWVLWTKFTGESVAGWASTYAIVSLLGGVQLISLGVIGEYIGKIYLETKNRPRYIISKRTYEENTNSEDGHGLLIE